MARGSVFKRGKVWAIRYDAGWNEQKGKREQPYESGFASQQEAQARLAQCLHEVATGTHVRSDTTAFGAYAAYWLETLVPGTVRGTTRINYTGEVRGHLIPGLGKHRLQELKRGHVQRFYRDCAAKGLAPSMIRNLHARLKQIIASAVTDHLILPGLLDDVTPPRMEHTEMQVWTAAHLAAFLIATADELPYGPLWHLYAMTGMRRGEALGLRWRDIDWQQRVVQVRQQAIYEDATVLRDVKTTSSRRSISVGQQTMEVLAGVRRRQRPLQMEHRVQWQDNDLVFPREPGEHRGQRPPYGVPQLGTLISRAWRVRVARTDLPAIRLHDLRHTHATLMLAEDGNIKALAARLGHDPAVLLRIYAHALPEHQERAVQRFEALLQRACEPVQDGALGTP